MNYTNNLGLKKPEYSDPADVAVINDNMDTIDESIKKWILLDGVGIKDGTDIVPMAIEKGEHGFYASGGNIYPVTYDGYRFYKIPIEGGATYYFDEDVRWCFTTDADGNVVDTTAETNIRVFETSGNAVLLWCTFYSVNQDYRMVAKGAVPKDTIYEIPQNVAITSQISFSDLSGKLTSDMVEGYELGNLNVKMELVQEHAYAYVGAVGQEPIFVSHNSFNVYSLDVTPDVYSFLQTRFLLPLDEEGKAVAIQSDYATSFDNTNLNATKLYFSIIFSSLGITDISGFKVSKGTVIKEKDTYPNWVGYNDLDGRVNALKNKVDAMDSNLGDAVVSGTGQFTASGQYIVLGDARTNLRKGIRLVFESTVSSGTDFELGFSVSENSDYGGHNIVGVTSTNIVYNGVNYAHGLTIANRLQMIFEYLPNGTADITLMSNGNTFKQNVSFVMSSVAVPYVKSKGLVATNCKFTFICSDIRKKIWCFGDSYFAHSSERWTYYLEQYGYAKNVLLDGWSGMGSVNGVESFRKLIQMGKPSYAVWFLGMNDGSDIDDSTPTSDWATRRDRFLALCEANGVTPIFATIPNVPNINHNGKNAWIKSSGYRYIDMCHAVGADVTTNWYGDMLSSDNIHPSESGAKALFSQVLLDLPEIMIDNL